MTNWELVDNAARRWSGHGVIGAAVETLKGDAWSQEADRRFVAASTIKIPVMIDLYRKIDACELSESTRVEIGSACVPGTGILQHMRPDLELTVDELCTLMIAISDNVATNLLVDLVGLDSVNRTIADLGMGNSHMGRKMLGRRATSADGENWVTPADLNRSVRAILDGSAASPASCERMKTMLTRQDGSRRVTRFAPEGSRWGSKPGMLPGIINDAGFIETDRGTAIISVCCEGFAEDHEAERAIAEIARAALQALELADER